jgi:hypothetical protein
VTTLLPLDCCGLSCLSVNFRGRIYERANCLIPRKKKEREKKERDREREREREREATSSKRKIKRERERERERDSALVFALTPLKQRMRTESGICKQTLFC